MTVAIDTPGKNWTTFKSDDVEVRFSGYLNDRKPSSLPALVSDGGSLSLKKCAAVVASLDGHFAMIASNGRKSFAAVDRVRSIPLCWAKSGEGISISSHAPALGEQLGLPLDEEQARILAMAGFTIAGHTLFAGLRELKPGEWVGWDGERVSAGRYYCYQPWRTLDKTGERWLEELAELTIRVMQKVVASADGRCILAPLSGGLDSRLVVSALHHLGYRNVKCFAYGIAGNHEAAASRSISERLGYQWTFVPHSTSRQSALFGSDLDRDYRRQTDTGAAVPFPQDLLAVKELLDSGYVDRSAIVVNGQTGDYISGNHVPDTLFAPIAEPEETRWRRIFDALVGKHYSLWASLKTSENLALVERLLKRDLEEDGVWLADPEHDYAVYEYSEYQNRQAKYVINGQRIYDFLGLEWRLPLWDRDFVDFWEQVPINYKARQTLYLQMLMAKNWGGVWERASWPRTVMPLWMKPVRLACKLALAPLGKKNWHNFEKRYLEYWMDVVSNYAVVDYATVARDKRGHRNAISWHVERYLAEKGLAFDGLPAEPAL